MTPVADFDGIRTGAFEALDRFTARVEWAVCVACLRDGYATVDAVCELAEVPNAAAIVLPLRAMEARSEIVRFELPPHGRAAWGIAPRWVRLAAAEERAS